MKGHNNPNYGRKFGDDFKKLQSQVQSKVPILITDTVTGEVNEFENSKDAAKFLDCRHGDIRTYKAEGWLIRRRYRVENKIITENEILG